MLELMHFPEELLDTSEFKEPVEKPVAKAEMQMAKQLMQSMTSKWNPEEYTDPRPFEGGKWRKICRGFKSRGVHRNRRDIALAPLEFRSRRTNRPVP